MDPNMLKHYVLLHDNTAGAEAAARAEETLKQVIPQATPAPCVRAQLRAQPADGLSAQEAGAAQMRETLGVACCSLIRVNSAPPGAKPGIDIWSAYRPQAVTPAPAPLHARARREPQGRPAARSKLADRHTLRGALVQTGDEPSIMRGALMSPEDRQGIERFVADFTAQARSSRLSKALTLPYSCACCRQSCGTVASRFSHLYRYPWVQGLVPHMDKRIRSLNQQVSSAPHAWRSCVRARAARGVCPLRAGCGANG